MKPIPQSALGDCPALYGGPVTTEHERRFVSNRAGVDSMGKMINETSKTEESERKAVKTEDNSPQIHQTQKLY